MTNYNDIRYDGVISAGVYGKATRYTTSASLPLTNLVAGEMAIVRSNLFITNGSGWYKIALVNESPSINLSPSTVNFTSSITSNTVTYTITEPEGIPTSISITYSFTSNANVVLNTNNNTIDVTSLNNTAPYSGNITVTVSDGINIGTATITVDSVLVILNSNYNALLVKASSNSGTNTSITDSSSNTHTVTVNGDVTAGTFSPYRHGGYSYYFDGNGDTLTVNNPFAFGTNDFTVEFWYNPSVQYSSSSTARLLGGEISGSGATWGVTFSTYAGANGMMFGVGTYGSNTGGRYVNGYWGTKGQWDHIVWQRNSGTIECYINGVSQTLTTMQQNFTWFDGINITGTKNLTIGSNGSGEYFTGYMKELRITSGSALYTSGVTVPTEAISVGSANFLGLHLPYLADGSSNNYTISVSGNVSSKPLSPYNYRPYSASSHGGSVYFGATSSYLYAPTSEVALGSGDFTAEVWVYPTSVQSSGSIMDWRSAGLAATNVPALAFISSTGQIGWYASPGSAANITSSTNAIFNQWNHLVTERSGSTITMYLNGKSVGSYTSSATFGVQRFRINDSQGSYQTYGYFSDARITVGSAVYGSNFTPPTSPVSSTGASLHIKGTDAKVYDATQKQTLTLNGDAKSSTTQTKYAPASIALDGSGDTVSISTVPALASDFTIDFWVYFTTVRNSDFFGAPTSSHMYIDYYAGYLRLGDYGGGYNVRGAWSPSSSTWYHIAAVRNNGITKLFVDGTELASASDTFSYPASTTHKLGYTANGYLDGYIEDFRITEGLSRYPWIPPKETLTAVSGTSLLTTHAATITDGSSNSHTVTAYGNAAVSDIAPASGMKSVYFDGTGDYLSVPDSDDFNLDGAFTIEFYVRIDDSTIGGIFSSSHTSFEFNATVMVWDHSTHTDKLGFWDKNTSSNVLLTTETLNTDQWYHIALVRDGSNNTIMFVDGTKTSTSSSITGTVRLSQSSGTLKVGSYWNGDFQGYISNFRVVKGTAVYSDSFTPPTAELEG